MVVAGEAGGRSFGEGLRHVAVVACERGRSDAVGDPMAAGIRVVAVLLGEETERDLRASVVGDVPEGLLVAGLRRAGGELRVVGLEVARDRMAHHGERRRRLVASRRKDGERNARLYKCANEKDQEDDSSARKPTATHLVEIIGLGRE